MADDDESLQYLLNANKLEYWPKGIHMIKTFFSSNNLQYTDKNFFNLTFKLLSMIELQNFNKFEYWDETIKIIKYFFKGYEIKTEEDKLFTLTCNLFVNIDLKDFKDEKAGI